MKSPPPPPPRNRRHHWHPILPVIYLQPQSRAKRLFPIFLVCTCGFWIFTMGALIERLPHHGRELPNLSVYLSSSSTVPSSTSSLSTTPLSSSLESISIQSARKTTHQNMPLRSNLNTRKNTSSSSSSIGSAKSEAYFDIQSAVREEHQDQIIKSQQRHTMTNHAHLENTAPYVHQHDIPNVLIFTHNINLLTYQPPKTTTTINDNNNNTKATIEEQEELLALQQNIQHTIDLHPNAQVRFLTDTDCLLSLETMLGSNAPLIHYFQTETTGMYKADICRGAALWETGGLYLDVDVGVRMPLWNALSRNTTFCTSLVHKQSNHVGNFFQAIMGTTPRHVILERYLQLFQDYYQGNLTRPITKGPLGVILLRQAFDDVMGMTAPAPAADHHDHTHPPSKEEEYFRLGPKTLDTTSYGRVQIWQEVQYNPQWFPDLKPAPTWGTRRACHFVVVSNRKFPLIVPLYSRIAGSRICKATHDNTTKNNKSKSKDATNRHKDEDTQHKHNHHHHDQDHHHHHKEANTATEDH